MMNYLPRLVLALICIAIPVTAQPTLQSEAGPWGATTAEWRSRQQKHDGDFVQMVQEPNGDTTLVYSSKPVGVMLFRFDADGLFSIRNLLLVDPSDGPAMHGAFATFRQDMLRTHTLGHCELSESISPDTMKKVVQLSCPDSLTTRVSVENTTKDRKPCVAFIVELFEGDRTRDRRRKR
jgi:hypothetical protein